MKTKNKLRKVYMAYLIILGEVFCAAFILSSGYIAQEPLKTFITVAGFAGAVIVPLFLFFFYRWIRRDNAEASDELEQLVVTKAFALTGLISLSLLPFLLLLSAIFPQAAGYIVLGYAIIVGGTYKIGTVLIYKKY